MNFYDYTVTSDYGARVHPISGKNEIHNGIDYALPLNTNIQSNVSGTVTTSGYNQYNGNYVVVKDGTGKMHYYLHLNKSNVNVGDTVSVGDSLGLSGSTGSSTGPHLHYEVKENGVNVNPSNYTVGFVTETTSGTQIDVPSMDDYKWYDIKGKLKVVVFNIFKFIIIALLVVLFVVFITKSLDIKIL